MTTIRITFGVDKDLPRIAKQIFGPWVRFGLVDVKNLIYKLHDPGLRHILFKGTLHEIEEWLKSVHCQRVAHEYAEFKHSLNREIEEAEAARIAREEAEERAARLRVARPVEAVAEEPVDTEVPTSEAEEVEEAEDVDDAVEQPEQPVDRPIIRSRLSVVAALFDPRASDRADKARRDAMRQEAKQRKLRLNARQRCLPHDPRRILRVVGWR